MKVLWTDSALAQLQAIHGYLAQSSPEYALRIVDRLTARSIQIATFRFSGRMVSEYELNEVREVIEERAPQLKAVVRCLLRRIFNVLTPAQRE